MTGAALVVLALVLLLVAGGLACTEAALARVSRVRGEELAREGRPGAAKLLEVLSDPARYLNLLLLLRLAAEVTAIVVITLLVVEQLGYGLGALLAAAAVMTVVSYVLLGVAPRTVGQQHAVGVALRTAGLARALTRVFGPLPRLLILIGNALTPGRGFREGPFASEAELRDLVDVAEQRGFLEREERDMIKSVFNLGDKIVREVMVPRTDIVFIERGKTVRQALTLALRSGFSRLPVVGDNEDDVIGIAYLKDLVRKTQDLREGDRPSRIEEVVRAPFFVPDSKPVDEMLREMQSQQIHLAIVIDEYGGTAGLVTIEDILEEIVGEITDEYDREAPPVEEVDATTTRITARLSIEDLNEHFGTGFATDDVETVGGLLASALGRVPIPGATATLQGLTLTAEGAEGRRNRIGTVLVQHPVRNQDNGRDDGNRDGGNRDGGSRDGGSRNQDQQGDVPAGVNT